MKNNVDTSILLFIGFSNTQTCLAIAISLHLLSEFPCLMLFELATGGPEINYFFFLLKNFWGFFFRYSFMILIHSDRTIARTDTITISENKQYCFFVTWIIILTILRKQTRSWCPSDCPFVLETKLRYYD